MTPGLVVTYETRRDGYQYTVETVYCPDCSYQTKIISIYRPLTKQTVDPVHRVFRTPVCSYCGRSL